jgi:hypothetical protein
MRAGSLLRPVPPRNAEPAFRSPQSTLILPEQVQRPSGVSAEAWQRSRTWSTDY